MRLRFLSHLTLLSAAHRFCTMNIRIGTPTGAPPPGIGRGNREPRVSHQKLHELVEDLKLGISVPVEVESAYEADKARQAVVMRLRYFGLRDEILAARRGSTRWLTSVRWRSRGWGGFQGPQPTSIGPLT